MMMKGVKNGFNYSKMEFGKNKTAHIPVQDVLCNQKLESPPH